MSKKTVSGMMLKLLLLGIVTLAFNIRPLKAEFSEPTQWTGLSNPIGVAIGDYDNDGLNDLAFAEDVGGRVTVYKSDGTTVIKQWTGLGKPQGVAIGDYDNDGLNDLAFTEYSPQTVTVYKSDGTTVIKQWTGIPSQPIGVAIGDYDNDGLNDLAFTDGPVSYYGHVIVYKSDGTTVIKEWTDPLGTMGVAIGDYDNDGLNDLAFTEFYIGRVTVYRSDGTTVIKQWTGLSGPHGVAIGDYNNDGLNDLAVAEGGGNVTVYSSDGTTVIKQWTGLSVPYGVAIGDYDNDGLNDLAFSENTAGRVTVYYAPAVAPIANFTYSPTNPYVGETVTFDASASNDPDGTIVSYLWDFGDWSSGNGVITSHVYGAGGTYTVALTVTDNDGLNSTTATDITVLRTIMNVQVKAGSIHFRGEIAEFYILVSSLGKPLDANINATLYYNGTLYANLSTSVEHISQGFYRIPYTIPLDALTGTYVMVVNASYLTLSGISLESFLLSPTFTGWNPLLVSINGTTATIKTDLGLIQIKLEALNATVTHIDGTTVRIQTLVGVLNGTITFVKDNIATIVIPGVGQIETDISSLKGTQETWTIPVQYVITALALIAAVASTLSIIMIRRRKTA